MTLDMGESLMDAAVNRFNRLLGVHDFRLALLHPLIVFTSCRHGALFFRLKSNNH